MNGTNVIRLILSALVLTWAAFSLIPVKDTDYETYLVERVTAQYDEEGNISKTQAESANEFQTLIERAQARVEEKAAAGTPSSTFLELQNIASEEAIDLSDYFADLSLRDIKNLKKKNKTLLTALLQFSKGSLQPGLDLAGGVSITFEIPESELQSSTYLREQQLADARNVILNRVDGLGVAEPVVRVKGDNKIEVQMPGIDTKANPNITEVISAPALLEFKLVNMQQRAFPGATPPRGYEIKTEEREDPENGEIIEVPYFVTRIPTMTGDAIADARPDITGAGGYEVRIKFTDEGADQFAEVTGQIAKSNSPQNPGQLAIILDGKLMSAPTVRERIAGGSAVITGNFTQREAFELANALNNPLAVELNVVEMYEVGPTLAKESKDASLRAGYYGAAFVIIFMIFWYGIPGLIAMLTVTANIFIVIGALAAFGATITLPGIAALILTVGMAVDANILIFERIREELKTGKSIGHAVADGYSKALSTIVDANITTLITSIVLIVFGTGPVKGFGVTLSAGIVSTVFAALILSHFLMDVSVKMGLIKSLPNRFSSFGEKEIPFLNYAKRAFGASWLVVILGVAAFIYHFDSAFGIDFRGGDELSVTYTGERLTPAQIDAIAEAQSLGEVITIYQTPLGAEEEIITIQTEVDQGQAVFNALSTAYPQSDLELQGISQIGSSVGAEVQSSALWSMGIALLGILFYIAVRFEFGYGLGALVATVHDVLMTVGIFVFLGEFLGWGSGQFTAPMIAAVLMTVGYSINDTIVVFDRIREELDLNPGMNLKKVIHLSINRVLSRTILTSITTVFASLALYLFGAGVIVDFALVFLLGIITGTFSSMFIASPVFYWYHKGDRKHVEKGEILPSYDWTSEQKSGKA